MKLTYENCTFEIDLKYSTELRRLFYEYFCRFLGKKFTPLPSVSRLIFRQNLKKKFGKLLGKPYVADPYLSFAFNLFSPTSSPIIIDIGANIGTTVLPLAKHTPGATIYAVEPHPECLAKLLHNKKLNKLHQVKIISTAIGKKSEFSLMKSEPSNDGGHHLITDRNQSDFNEFSVITKSLRDLFLSFNITHCDLLKIDVEGSDFQVVESLGELLQPQTVKNLVIEYNIEKLSRKGITGWDIVSYGITRGYNCCLLNNFFPIKAKEDIPLIDDGNILDFLFTKSE